MYWIKTTMYQYLTKKHGNIKPPADLKAVGSPVDEAEYAYPDPDKLPLDAPLKRYEEGDSNVGLATDLVYFINPLSDKVYYYEVEFFLRLESSALALHLHDADAGGIVDEYLGTGQNFQRAVHIIPVEPFESARLELLHLDL